MTQAILSTRHGDITIEFLPEVAPNHVQNFLDLARSGFYDGTKFHRVIPGFMIQGGDPNSKEDDRRLHGTGGSGKNVKAEFNATKHVRGIVSMARAASPDSASSQFFIMVADSPHLDGQYSAFGKVVSGLDVADKIVAEETDHRDNPLNPVTVTVKVVD
ncbi:MAG TPA: peptidylprolyl isomerase [Fibrobacteria bacterium]|jgi:peptidyl-prolyl cis-trans isomerase B (cyclophilin B)|nr:peptidylprolyl isomerase [Fibrobacteria bacterium]